MKEIKRLLQEFLQHAGASNQVGTLKYFVFYRSILLPCFPRSRNEGDAYIAGQAELPLTDENYPPNVTWLLLCLSWVGYTGQKMKHFCKG